MVRSMYSGVAGMKAHQVRMDVIGNNISNVNTYGFKGSRATFRDIYYQSIRGAAGASGNKGGVNPSTVGYGAQIASTDVLMGQSTLTNTGNGLDVAISGEGYFQVQDADGNIYYTRAGMLNIDSFGNLVDSNGNFVLGVSGDPLGKPADKQKIQIAVPSVNPTRPSVSETINDIKWTISGSKETTDGNVNFSFVSSQDVPVGKSAEAILTSSGVTIKLNPTATFDSVGVLQSAVNEAIREANGGAQHPAGEFSITADPANKVQWPLKGSELVGKNFGIEKGSVDVPAGLFGGATFNSVGDGFTGASTTGAGANTVYKVERTPGEKATNTKEKLTFSVTVGGKTYTTTINAEELATGRSVLLKNSAAGAASDDWITIDMPSASSIYSDITDPAQTMVYTQAQEDLGILPLGYKAGDTGPKIDADGDFTNALTAKTTVTTTVPAKASAPAKDVGLGSKSFLLAGGTEGGPQTVADLSGITIGADGVITAFHAVHGQMEVGRIDLAMFENNNGLEQSGQTYFVTSKNSGEAILTRAGEGGTGALKSSSLEQSNVDLSQEFSDMITTQRGFQANSRLITVSDTMLEELINLKR